MLSNKIILVLVMLFVMEGCKEDNITNPLVDEREKLVMTRIDLQSGFANNIVFIEINNDFVFNATLSPFSPLSGPEATFATYLPIGTNNLIVAKRDVETFTIFKIDSASFNIGNKEKYFIGLQFFDSLICIVQDSTFWYL